MSAQNLAIMRFLDENKLQSSLPTNLVKETQETIYAFAYGFYESGNYEKAIRFFQFLTQIDRNVSKYWKGLGASYQMLKEYSPAVKCYARAALLDEKDPYPHWHAAKCFWMEKNHEMVNEALLAAEITASHEPVKYRSLLEKFQLIKRSNKKRKVSNK